MNSTCTKPVMKLAKADRAVELYESGNFESAIDELHDVLDSEPDNWYARFILAACYYRTSRWSAARAAFRFIGMRCNDQQLRARALEGLKMASAKIDNRTNRCEMIGKQSVAPPTMERMRPARACG